MNSKFKRTVCLTTALLTATVATGAVAKAWADQSNSISSKPLVETSTKTTNGSGIKDTCYSEEDCISMYKDLPGVSDEIKYIIERNGRESKKSINTINCFTDQAMMDCISKYKNNPNIAGDIIKELIDNYKFFYGCSMGRGPWMDYEQTRKHMVGAANILSNEIVVKCILGFEATPDIRKQLTRIAFNTVDMEIVTTIANCLLKYEKLPEAAVTIVNPLAYKTVCAWWYYFGRGYEKGLIDAGFKKGLIDIPKAFSDESVVNLILKYDNDPNTTGKIVEGIMYITFDVAYDSEYIWEAPHIKSEKKVMDAALCISKYPEVAGEITDAFRDIASNTRSEKAVSDAAQKISEAKTPEEAVEIAKRLQRNK